MDKYLTKLTSTETSDFSLWKATRKLNQQQTSVPLIRKTTGEWARSISEKAVLFAERLQNVFTPTSGLLRLDEE